MNKTEILKLLCVPDKEERLDNLACLVKREPVPAPRVQYANNHIHTTYSFSPYSPTAAVWFARDAGLLTAGIMDHDSIGGADEFRAAGRLAGIGTTCGLECRVSMAGTAFSDRKLNSPDQPGIAYMALHSVPQESFKKAQAFFAPLREKRNERSREMVKRINTIILPAGISLDFDCDVAPISMFRDGGSITERHILCALADKIIGSVGVSGTAAFLSNSLGIILSEKQKALLGQADPLCFRYDVLGILKSSLNARTYIPATDELVPFNEMIAFARELGAILCYAYLGDVKESPTGDKKAEKFEDSFLDELFEVLYGHGVRAITFMPSRNTREQAERLMGLCQRYEMKQISGEDINQPRQSFICPQLAEPMFSHLVGAAWELVEREK